MPTFLLRMDRTSKKSLPPPASPQFLGIRSEAATMREEGNMATKKLQPSKVGKSIMAFVALTKQSPDHEMST